MSEAERLVAAAVDELGAVDILVNNAEIGRFGLASELAVDAWIETIETNLSGVFYYCRAAIPVMKRRGRRWMSTSAASPASTRSPGVAYCASKAGLNALTESLMQEVRPDGIRVSSVLPGSVNTETPAAPPCGTARSRASAPPNPPCSCWASWLDYAHRQVGAGRVATYDAVTAPGVERA